MPNKMTYFNRATEVIALEWLRNSDHSLIFLWLFYFSGRKRFGKDIYGQVWLTTARG